MFREMVAVYAGQLLKTLPSMAAAAVAVALAGFAARRWSFWRRPPVRRGVPRAIFAASLAGGLALAWQKKSLFDDAFISFRYASHFLRGDGLVYNVGERVEGYTNFLWTILLAGLSWLTRVELPHVALYACLVCFAGNLATVWRLGRRLSAPEAGQFFLPLAVPWLATEYVFSCYATSGMETMFASWLVSLAAYCLVARTGSARAALTGGLLILAVFTRPDHALFYAAAGGVLAWQWAAGIRRAGRGRRRAAWRAAAGEAAAFAAPALAYGVYLIWKYHYYGDIVPNTFYAKSVAQAYWRQGLAYVTVSGLSEHLFLLAALFAVWALTVRDARFQEFRRFAVLSVAVYTAFIVRLGGDFMYGRFFVSLTPLLAVAVEQGVHEWARRTAKAPAWRAVAVAALMAAACWNVPLIGSRAQRWNINEVSSRWRLPHWPKIEADNLGRAFKRLLLDKGVPLTIATSGIGHVGYYSDLPVIDELGLTDAFVGHRSLRTRGQPGHEKLATTTYLDARGVRLAHMQVSDEREDYAAIEFDGDEYPDWWLYRYDPALMNRLAEASPRVTFTRFEKYLDANYRDVSDLPPRTVAEKLQEFDHYYFSLADNAAQRRPFVARFRRLWDFEDHRFPDGTSGDESVAPEFLSPARAGDYEIEGYQGETLLRLPPADLTKGDGWLRFPAFAAAGDEIGFLLGSKGRSDEAAAVLTIDGAEIARWTGRGDGVLRRETFSLTPYRGRQAQLALVNASREDYLFFDMFYEADEAEAGDAQ
jgi:hypothetical protein